MIKVMTIVGTRPELIRLSRIISKLDENTDHKLVHTGQNFDFELNQIFFDDLGIRKPNLFLDAACKTASESIGKIISESDKAIRKFKPDAILVLGDTNSSLSAIAAKRLKVPIFHMEAGNRCFDFRVPEEINRRIVDHISDINLPYSKIARDYLLKEGLPADQIIKIGSPMKEVLNFYSDAIESSNIIEDLKLNKGDYFVLSAHREENVDSNENLEKIINIFNHIGTKFNKKIIFSMHPRTKARLRKIKTKLNSNIIIKKPFGFLDYINLQKNSRCVFSDSGTITEESSILNFRALNIRDTNERPEGFEEGAVMMTSLDKERILDCLSIVENQSSGPNRDLNIVDDYNVDNVSEKVLRIILSYTNYINQKVWKKV